MVVDFPFLWGSGCHDVPSLRCCKLLQPAGWSFCHPYMMTNVMDQFSQFVGDWGQCWVWKVRKFVRTATGGFALSLQWPKTLCALPLPLATKQRDINRLPARQRLP